MSGIFISYRREDSGPYAGRLRDTLSRHFGPDQIFRDIDRIGPGERFPAVIERAVGSCDALLALIGPNWLGAEDENRMRRLDDDKDYLRQEIAAALARDDVLVIPVLIGSASMPGREDLPEPIAGLADHNALRLSDEGWDDQVARLTRTLEQVVQPDDPEGHLQESVAPAWAPPQRQPAWREAPQQPPPVGQPQASAATDKMSPARALLAVVTVIVVGAVGFAAVKALTNSSNTTASDPTVVLSRSAGPPGTRITVTGTGYGKEETIVVRFHATEVGTTVAEADGTFTAEVTIPPTPFRNQQFDISASGKRTIRHDSAPFMVQ